MTTLEQVFFLSCAVSSISFTVTSAKIFAGFRSLFDGGESRIKRFFRYLLGCYYCFSHWVAFPLSLYFNLNLFEGGLGLIITPFVIVWISVMMTTVVDLIFKTLGK